MAATRGRLKVRRLGYAAGAEVTGLDIAQALDDATVAEIREAWLEHLVLCFPGQRLERPGDFTAFARRFGDLDETSSPYNRQAGDDAAIIHLVNKPTGEKSAGGSKQGQTWHSDQSYTLRPNLATLLLSKELPEVGGGTLFANQYMAYESLSSAMQRLVDGLSAIHDVTMSPTFGGNSPELRAQRLRENPPIVQRVVRIHPETGRKALYVGERVRNFLGMTEEESAPLLGFLNQHATRYENTYWHRWQRDDLVIWDNRCLLHRALADYDQWREPRHMWRCSLRGEPFGYVYEPAVVMQPAS